MSDAVDRIRRYLDIRRAVPMRGLDDAIHGIHAGNDHAEIRLSDLIALVAEIDSLRESKMSGPI